MRFETSNCIALGVKDMDAALSLYGEKLGFEITRQTQNWSELNSGALKIFLIRDEVREPCFDLTVENVDEAERRLLEAGFTKVEINQGEHFVRDPLGYLFCITSR